MIPRNVVKAAFRFEETDIVPYWIPMSVDVKARLDEYYGTPSWCDKIVPHLYGHHTGNPVRQRDDDYDVDGFGSVVELGNIWHVVQPVLSEPSLGGYVARARQVDQVGRVGAGICSLSRFLPFVGLLFWSL